MLKGLSPPQTTMNEFELIDSILSQLGQHDTQGPAVAVGPGDDAAVIDIPLGHQLVVSTDTLLPGVHYPADCPSELIGFRAMAVNVSDLAAMAAQPIAATIALTLDRVDERWLRAFVHGIAVAANRFDVSIVGGNLARGPTNISVHVQGVVPTGTALLRSGVVAGDDLWLTGVVGATTYYLSNPVLTEDRLEELLDSQDDLPTARYFLPHPRVEFSVKIRDLAHAAIDVSDGLNAELNHLARASRCGFSVHLERVPVWETVDPVTACGNDDSYELLFTAEPESRKAILDAAQATNTAVTLLGQATEEQAVNIQLDGKYIALPSGYDHFDRP